MVSMMLAVLFPCLVDDVAAPPKTHFKVGQLIIVGNEVVPYRVILGVVDFWPGQSTTRTEVLGAEARLQYLGFFKVDKTRQIQPTIKILEGPPGAEFLDLLITVHEKPLNWAVLPLLENVIVPIMGGKSLRFVLLKRAIDLADETFPGLWETQVLWPLRFLAQ